MKRSIGRLHLIRNRASPNGEIYQDSITRSIHMFSRWRLRKKNWACIPTETMHCITNALHCYLMCSGVFVSIEHTLLPHKALRSHIQLLHSRWHNTSSLVDYLTYLGTSQFTLVPDAANASISSLLPFLDAAWRSYLALGNPLQVRTNIIK